MYSCYITQEICNQIFFIFIFLLYKIQFNKLTKWKSFKKMYVLSKIFVYTRLQQKNINSFLSFVKLETIMYTCCVAWQNSIMSFLCHISVFLKWDVFFLIFYYFIFIWCSFHFLLFFLYQLSLNDYLIIIYDRLKSCFSSIKSNFYIHGRL